jgi:hypothetical protein
MMVPGARIELATPAFSGRRSTTELPRHVWFRNCMGCGAIVSIRCDYSGVPLGEVPRIRGREVSPLAHNDREIFLAE